MIRQFEGLDLYLPAMLGVACPGPAYAHHRTQCHICWQVAECTDSRAVGLLEREDGEATLVAELNGHQRATYVGLSAGHK